MAEVSKKKFAVNALWKILEQFSAKGVSMIVSVILARILSASDYGLLALTAVFTNLSDILIDGGFGAALIRKETVDEKDYGAVFSVSSSVSVLLYAIIFFSAPFVARYYDTPQLTSVLRVIGLTFFIQSFTAVQNGIVNRNMQFRLLFFCNTTASIVSGIVGIIAAYSGMGVWSLVIQRLTQQALLTLMLLIKVKWKFRWQFDFSRIKQMLSFTIGVVGSSLLNYMGGSVYSVVIGKKYSVTDLGYSDKGGQLPMQFSLYTFGAMSNVLFPTISSCQSDLERVRRIIRKVVGMTSFLIMPMMTGMAFVSRELILLLFTEKWLPSVPFMYTSCLYYLATPYMLINVQVFFALGRSELRVKTEIFRLVMLFAGLGIFGFVLNCTIIQLAAMSAVVAVLSSIISYFEVRKLIEYKVREVISDMGKPLAGSLAMGAVLWALERFVPVSGVVFMLLLKVLAGAAVYLLFVLLLKMPEKDDVMALITKRKNK